jgi:hypothetical protein
MVREGIEVRPYLAEFKDILENVTTFSNQPQFGLRQHTLDEGVTIHNSLVDFHS